MIILNYDKNENFKLDVQKMNIPKLNIPKLNKKPIIKMDAITI